CIDEGLAQTLVLEFFPSGIEEPTLRARGRIIGDYVALDAPLADRRQVVAGCPGARGEFLPEQIAFGGEPLEGNFAIAVIFIAQDIEIVLATRDRQVGAPPVFHSLVLDMAAELETSDLIRPAAERYFERSLLERTLRVIGTRKNRQRSHEQRHVAPPLGGKMRYHGRIIGRLRADEVAQQLLRDRVAFVLEDFQ